MVIIASMTFMSLFYWLIISTKSYRRKYVLDCLQINTNEYQLNSSLTAALYFGSDATVESANTFLLEKTGLDLMENFELFFNDVCSLDLIFAIQIIAINSHQLASRDILNNLWDQYLDLGDSKIKREIKQRPYISLKRPHLKIEALDQIEEHADMNEINNINR